MRTLLRSLSFCLILASARGQAAPASLASLPVEPVWPADSPDWLITATPYQAGVWKSADGRELVLSNGLIRRSFRLSPNIATVAFDQLRTGQSLLRSPRPEAEVEIDGVRSPVGGLVGQPIQNHLRREWVDTLRSDPASWSGNGFDTGRIAERFPWKKRPDWMPQDRPWPPPGVSLTLHFTAPAEAGKAPRPVVWEDTFATVDAGWKSFVSPKSPRSSTRNEGKQGEIMALENTHAFLERPWADKASAVEVRIDPGTDKSASWGPGLGCVDAFGRVFKIHLRPGKGKLAVTDKGNERELSPIAPGQPVWLRLSWANGRGQAESSPDGQKWTEAASFDMPARPRLVRVGKLGKDGNANDNPGELGELQRCRLEAFRFLGDAPPAPPRTPGSSPEIDVVYELYDGLPLISKQVRVRNTSPKPIRLNSFTGEILAVVEAESYVDKNPRWQLPNLHVETDYAFAGMGVNGANAAVRWLPDPAYETQVHYERQTPCLLRCAPPLGPDQVVAPGATWEGFTVYELVHDGTDRERRGLAQRRMYRTIAPWVTENPLMMHVRSADPAAVRAAIDQCAEVGFEMCILTFGSGFNFESKDPVYQRTYRELSRYAATKKIALGGYSLLASRGAGKPEDNTVGPTTFGVMPCLGAAWGQDYLAQLKSFTTTAGLGVLEHDGSYPGDTCASTTHPGHRGLADSQWVQWRAITDLYRWCRGNGVHLNIPDWYFLNGGNKTGMGYRETNWSLPRAEQEIIERQNIYDGTWEKTPSMGWMFVPLTEYHGGGPAATIEPLKDHLPHYEQRLANLLGAGVQACWRGPRLFDTPETKAVVQKWVNFYRRHRPILDSDLIHLRRADGRDWDGWLHVNPTLSERGLLMVFNPLEVPIHREILVPLRYAGLTGAATFSERDGPAQKLPLTRDDQAKLTFDLPPKGLTWWTIGQ